MGLFIIRLRQSEALRYEFGLDINPVIDKVCMS